MAKMKDWNKTFNDETKTALTLKEARDNHLPFYRGNCKIHGNVPLATLDNSCRQCCTNNSAKRRKQNYLFNRLREKTNEIKQRAFIKGIPFDLDADYLRSIIPDMCPVLNVEFSSSNPDYFMSIDRLNPDIGYIKGNVAIISMKANRIKNNASTEEVRLVFEWMKSQV